MYIAKKVCTFAGNSFLKGEAIPKELVLKSKVPELVKTGVIEVVEDTCGSGKYIIPVHAEEGDLMVELSNEELVQVFDVLQSGADEAKQVIDNMTCNDALILIDVVESRKGIREYVKKHATALLKTEAPEEVPEEAPEEVNSDNQ